MAWKKYIFKMSVTFSRGNSYWDPKLQKSVDTPDWKRVEEDHIEIVTAPDICSAEKLAHARTIWYGVLNGWEGVCIWRVIGDKIETEEDAENFLNKWENE